ncbi:hypothetical protein [Gloeothece verrucosa]|uniref:Uncharacterized protein n=1 Tax=Gloeothece verrucosa (strain PCC 7822) TaxID=497965 RepID=E0UMU7_GLOV7|nr:hypothetical protein [Gloeothece verrucosa]ADN18277.1 conserved hypothetical protein [Gloeothece verrucosa PCC 7822]
MNPQILQQQIDSIERSGVVAPPNTWISSYVVTKKSGKSYRYYRLMTHRRDEEGKLKKKMLKYLGAEDSKAYKKMVAAIKRRNRIQALQRQLLRLMAQGQPQPRRRSRGSSAVNSPLTTSDRMLLVQLQQQLTELMVRFEQFEREMKRMQNSSVKSS